MDELIGRVIGPYEIKSLLGVGSIGRVYKASQTSLNRFVAIKILPKWMAQDDAFLTRLGDEALGAAGLRHPNILPIHDAGTIEGRHYIVMDYAPGGTLANRLDRGTMQANVAADMAAQIAEGLDYAHQHGVLHRDVKPTNILLDDTGAPLLADFGLAYAVNSDPGLVQAGVSIGAAEYVSPEQGRGQPIDGRSDLYSLGVVLYQMVTGITPFQGTTTMGVLYQVVHETPPNPRQVNKAVPEWLDRIIVRALAKQPEERYQTGREMAEALRSRGATEKVVSPAPSVDAAPVAAAKRAAAAKPAADATPAACAKPAAEAAPGEDAAPISEGAPAPEPEASPEVRIEQISQEWAAAPDGTVQILSQEGPAEVAPGRAPVPTPKPQLPVMPEPDIPEFRPRSRAALPVLAVLVGLLLVGAGAGTAFLLSGGQAAEWLPAVAAVPATRTPTAGVTVAPSPAPTATALPTKTSAPTLTVPPTHTALPSPSPSPTRTCTAAPSPTATHTVTVAPTATASPTAAATATMTLTPLPTATPSPTPATPTATAVRATPKPGAANLVLDFDTLGTWQRGNEPYGTIRAATDRKHEGTASARLDYNFPAVAKNYVVFTRSPRAAIAGKPAALSLWVYGDGSNHYLNAWLVDGQGEVRQVTFGQIAHRDTWQVMTAQLDGAAAWPQGHISGPDNGRFDYPVSLHSLVLDAVPDAGGPFKGTVYVDELVIGQIAPTQTPQPGSTAAPAVPTAAGTVSAPATGTPVGAPPPAASYSGRIVYRAGNDIMAVDAATKNTWAVHTYGRQPALRADGQVAFNGIGGGRDNLVMAPIGGGTGATMSLHPEDAYPSWSPSEETLVFHSSLQGDGSERLYILPGGARGQEAQALRVNGNDLLGTYPTWLGNWRIAFSTCGYQWGRGDLCGIWSINSDGSGEPAQMTTSLSDRATDALGGRLLFHSRTTGNWDVYVIPENGGAAQNLTEGPSQDAGAAFSPNGEYVAFMSDRDGWGIWVMGTDGSNPQKLMAVPAGFGDDWPNERLSWGR